MISIDLNRNWTSGSEESSECWTLQLSHALHWISGDLSSSVRLLLLQTHFYFKCSWEGQQDEQIFHNRGLSQKSPLTLTNTLLLPITLHRLIALPNHCKSWGTVNPFTHPGGIHWPEHSLEATLLPALTGLPTLCTSLQRGNSATTGSLKDLSNRDSFISLDSS